MICLLLNLIELLTHFFTEILSFILKLEHSLVLDSELLKKIYLLLWPKPETSELDLGHNTF